MNGTCDAPIKTEGIVRFCGRPAPLWNRFGDWSCGKHQNWLARKREAKAAAA